MYIIAFDVISIKCLGKFESRVLIQNGVLFGVISLKKIFNNPCEWLTVFQANANDLDIVLRDFIQAILKSRVEHYELSQISVTESVSGSCRK